MLPQEEPSLSIDFRVHDFAYPVGILRFRRFLEKSQWFSLDKLRAYQEERLRATVEQAYNHVPYYRRLFDERRLKPRDIRKIEDLRKLPVLTRENVRQNFRELRADNANRFLPSVEKTTGTTGTPLRFLIDKPSRTLEFVYYWRYWSWAGYRLGDSFADVRWDFFSRKGEVTDKAWHFQPHLRRLLLNGIRISRERIAEYAKALRKYRPRFIRGRPTSLYCVALLLRENGFDDISFEAAFAGGEVVMPEMRETIEKTFGCKVLDSYGHMEKCMAVSQCLEGNYHINLEYGIIELADPKQGEDGCATGRVVCTSLHKMAMPFLRYAIEDVLEVYPDEKRCPCGRSLPLVKAIHGRIRPIFLAPDGRPIATVAGPFLSVKGVRLFQFVYEEPGLMVVRIVKGNGYTLGTEQVLKLWLSRLIGDGVRVELQYVSENDLERDSWGNIQMVISRVETRPEELCQVWRTAESHSPRE
jgi:phenylacetate-CoA ligase